eukprot:2802121-Rhodomonas_salina.1
MGNVHSSARCCFPHALEMRARILCATNAESYGSRRRIDFEGEVPRGAAAQARQPQTQSPPSSQPQTQSFRPSASSSPPMQLSSQPQTQSSQPQTQSSHPAPPSSPAAAGPPLPRPQRGRCCRTPLHRTS